jgi:ferredoxin
VKVELNRELCTGHGRCYALAPEVFEADEDDGYGVVRMADVPPELESAARKGAGNCPENAISIIES